MKYTSPFMRFWTEDGLKELCERSIDTVTDVSKKNPRDDRNMEFQAQRLADAVHNYETALGYMQDELNVKYYQNRMACALARL